MAVTVVIPTYNRSNKIIETLNALCNQDFGDFSVIVVNDGSVDNTVNAILEIESQLRFPLQVISQKNAGASAATNLGVQKANSGLVILFDDDILPESSCISKHVNFHKENPGSILSGSADTDPKRAITDVQRYKLYMEEQWRLARPDTLERTSVDFDNFIITTANMSLDRETFLKLDGFSTYLRDGYDVDFGFRALLNSIPLYFDRTIKTIHNDQISLRYYASRQRAYSESKKKILSSHSELSNKIRIEPASRPSFIKNFIYGILRNRTLVRFFESNIFAKIVPQYLRYRVYGSTIAALSLKK